MMVEDEFDLLYNEAQEGFFNKITSGDENYGLTKEQIYIKNEKPLLLKILEQKEKYSE